MHLNLIDRVQRRFLREIDINDQAALLEYCLAPLAARRCMAMLGVLHRIVLGIAPPQLSCLFPRAETAPMGRMPTRLWEIRHDLQLCERYFHADVFARSLYGMVRIYNLLPQSVVNAVSVKNFQRLLQNGLKRAAAAELDDWQALFSPTVLPLEPAAFQQILEHD